MARILSLGTGSLAAQLPQFLQHELIGIKRSGGDLEGIQLFQCDLTQEAAVIRQTLIEIGKVDVVLFTATPGTRVESAYRQTYCEIPAQMMSIMASLGWTPYWLHVSSTGVFQHQGGEWVHENTQPAPVTAISKLLRQSELLVEEYTHGASILRLAGLYGQGRTHLLNSLKVGRQVQSTPWSYTNRTHREDAVRAIAFLIERALQLPQHGSHQVEYFHGVDHEPAPLHEVAGYLAKLHGLPLPEYYSQKGEGALLSQNKRVGNRRLIEAGFQFKYPNYRQGFSA